MNKFARSLVLVGLSCWFLAGCVGTDVDDTGENDEALVQAEDAYQPDEALDYSEEDLSDASLESEGEYETEICSGFSGSGSVCHVLCSNYQWYRVGCYYGCSPFIDWGKCTPRGDDLCGRIGQGTGIQHCWN